MQCSNAHLITSINVKEKMADFFQCHASCLIPCNTEARLILQKIFLGFIYTSNVSWFITYTKQSLVNDQQTEKTRQDWCFTFKPQNCLKILFSVHAQNLEADSLHLDQKPRMRSAQPINDLFVAVFIVRQWPENSSTSFKRHFSEKFQGRSDRVTNVLPTVYSEKVHFWKILDSLIFYMSCTCNWKHP